MYEVETDPLLTVVCPVSDVLSVAISVTDLITAGGPEADIGKQWHAAFAPPTNVGLMLRANTSPFLEIDFQAVRQQFRTPGAEATTRVDVVLSTRACPDGGARPYKGHGRAIYRSSIAPRES